MRKIKFATRTTFAILLVSILLPSAVASATPGPKDERKVIICHATNSHTNPYTINDVDKSSIDEVNNKYLNGHGDHAGPIWYDGIADHSWGDIIPPFTNDAGNSFPGQNWTTTGKAIYDNGCELTEEPETETPGNNNGGGSGGGSVLGTNTKKTGELAPTGTPMIANLLLGTAIATAAVYSSRRTKYDR